MPVKKIPDGYSAVTPYLTVKGAAQAIDFYKRAFGAEEVMRFPSPDGKIMHAEVRIGGAVVMLHDEAPQWKAFSPQTVDFPQNSANMDASPPLTPLPREWLTPRPQLTRQIDVALPELR